MRGSGGGVQSALPDACCGRLRPPGFRSSLAVLFGMHALFADVRELVFAGGRLTIPKLTSIRVLPLTLARGSGVALLHFKTPLILTLLTGGVAGPAHDKLALTRVRGPRTGVPTTAEPGRLTRSVNRLPAI